MHQKLLTKDSELNDKRQPSGVWIGEGGACQDGTGQKCWIEEQRGHWHQGSATFRRKKRGSRAAFFLPGEKPGPESN